VAVEVSCGFGRSAWWSAVGVAGSDPDVSEIEPASSVPGDEGVAQHLRVHPRDNAHVRSQHSEALTVFGEASVNDVPASAGGPVVI